MYFLPKRTPKSTFAKQNLVARPTSEQRPCQRGISGPLSSPLPPPPQGPGTRDSGGGGGGDGGAPCVSRKRAGVRYYRPVQARTPAAVLPVA